MASNEDKQRELQQLAMQLEQARARHGQLTKQVQALEEGIAEVSATRDALKSLADQKPGTNILVPLGSGSFARATLADNESILLGAGAGITLEKKVEEAEKVLAGKEDELQKTLDKLAKSLRDTAQEAAALQQHVELRYQELQQLGGQ